MPSTTSTTLKTSPHGITFRTQRLERIIELLHATPGLSVKALVSALDVHPETVRVDLIHLEAHGLVRRDRGRVTLLSSTLPAPTGRPSFPQRRDRMLSLLSQHGPATVATLARELSVHEVTVRRDLERLRGTLVTFEDGRAALQGVTQDLPHQLRRDLNADAKHRLAQHALAFIQDGMTVGLDASTTCLALARLLRARPVTVVTPGLSAVEALLGGAAAVRVPGGTIYPGSRSVHGLTQRLPVLDVVILSCAALSPAGCLEDGHPEEAEVKRQLLSVARQGLALMDHTKLGQRAAHGVTPVTALDAVLVDRGAQDVLTTRWPGARIEVLAGSGAPWPVPFGGRLTPARGSH